MAMSKQDFIGLGDVIKRFKTHNPGEVGAEVLTVEIASYLACTYPRFDKELWLRYINDGCGDEVQTDWTVYKTGDSDFPVTHHDTEEEAEARIAEIEQTDPEGVHNGDYSIDGPTE